MYQPTHNTDMTIENHIQSKGRHILFLSADWCGDCRAIKPFVQDMKDTITKTSSWIDADRDDNLALATAHNMRGIPSFVLFQDGEELSRIGHGERLTPKQILDWYQTTI